LIEISRFGRQASPSLFFGSDDSNRLPALFHASVDSREIEIVCNECDQKVAAFPGSVDSKET
jgi:hypothetical protein